MSDEGFLRRWSRLKADPAAAQTAVAQPAPARATADMRVADARVPAIEPHPPAAPQPSREVAGAQAVPTLEDVARLNADSDFSAFVGKGVDKDVRRLAMKKLFSDPHFKLIDRLDVYMDDYNKPSPMSETMLAALHHTKNLFAPLASAAEEADANAGASAGAGEGGAPAVPAGEVNIADAPAGAAVTAAAADGAAPAEYTRVGPPATAHVISGAAPAAPMPAGPPAAVHAAADAAMRGTIAPVVQPAPAPVQLEPMQFHGAAAGGVFQQSQQGKA